MLRIILISIFLCSCLEPVVQAEENYLGQQAERNSSPLPTSKLEWSATKVAGVTLLFEGMLGVNAAMASSNPHAYGVAGVLLFPLAFTIGEGGGSKASNLALLMSTEALALYNLSINENKVSKKEIFRKNMIGWHAVIGIALSTGYLAGNFKKDDNKVSFNYLPDPHGGRLLISYRY